MPATVSDDQLAALVAKVWQLSYLADELKALADSHFGELLQPLVDQVDLEPAPNDHDPSPFFAMVAAMDEEA